MSGRLYRPRPDNSSGDSPRPPFLTEFVNHIREIFFAHVVYHLIGGPLCLRVHPHVERSFRLKTESALWVAQLERAQTQICEYAVRARFWNPFTDFSERTMNQRDFRSFLPQSLA